MLENFVTMASSMGLPWNNSFEYFEWNSTIHQSSIVNSSSGCLPKNEKRKFYILIFQIKTINTFLYNLHYKLLHSMKDKKNHVLSKSKETFLIQ
jgi:hypothetical protein